MRHKGQKLRPHYLIEDTGAPVFDRCTQTIQPLWKSPNSWAHPEIFSFCGHIFHRLKHQPTRPNLSIPGHRNPNCNMVTIQWHIQAQSPPSPGP